ncbi:MAG: hypothetical protein ABSH00_19080 [Bryobacteraceae bacterium]|jgi:hypothetical protein
MSIASELAANELKRRMSEQKQSEERRCREQRLAKKSLEAWNRIADILRCMVSEYNNELQELTAKMTSDTCSLEIVKFGRQGRTTRVHLGNADQPSIEFSVALGKVRRPPAMEPLFWLDLDSEGGLFIWDERKTNEVARVTEEDVATELLKIALT